MKPKRSTKPPKPGNLCSIQVPVLPVKGGKCILPSLPLELINHICSCLDGPGDALMLSSTCKALRSAMDSSNGQLWYGYFDHSKEIADVIAKYKDHYTEKDLKPLLSCVPQYILETLTRQAMIHAPYQDYIQISNIISQLSNLTVNYANPDIPGGSVKIPKFYQEYTKKYHESVDYRQKALRVLRGESHGEDLCQICMKPSGLLPELWSVKLEFLYTLGTKRVHYDKILCRDCVGNHLIICENYLFQQVNIYRTHSASPPVNQYQLQLFTQVLDSFENTNSLDPNSVYAISQQGNDPYEVKAIATGPLDFRKLIREKSVYKHFFEIHEQYNQLYGAQQGQIIKNTTWKNRIGPSERLHSLPQVQKLLDVTGLSMDQFDSRARKQVKLYLKSMRRIRKRVEQNVLENDEITAALDNNLFTQDTLTKFLDDGFAEALEVLGSHSYGLESNSNLIRSTRSHKAPKFAATSLPQTNYRSDLYLGMNMEEEKIRFLDVIDDISFGNDTSRNNIKKWIAASSEKILEKILCEPSLPITEASKFSLLQQQIWKYSQPKFSARQSKKAGHCKYCPPDDDVYYTPYTYAIHLYLSHSSEFYEDNFQWRPSRNGRGIAEPKTVMTKWERRVRHHQIVHGSYPPSCYGPYCIWPRNGSFMELGPWGDYYML